MSENNNDPQQSKILPGKGEGKPQKSGKLLIIVLCIVCAVVIATLAVVIVRLTAPKQEEEGYAKYEFDTQAMEGRISRMTDEEVQQELNKTVDEGMFRISIASSIVVNTVDNTALVNIENVPENRYYMQVDLTLDNTGEKIYSSKLIRPGYSIKTINVNGKIEPGRYAATASINAITTDTMELIGTVAAQVTVIAVDANGQYPVDE